MEFDLNHDLHSLLPPFYREIAEYQQVCDAEKAQFSRTADSVRVIGQNFLSRPWMRILCRNGNKSCISGQSL